MQCKKKKRNLSFSLILEKWLFKFVLYEAINYSVTLSFVPSEERCATVLL